MIAIGDSQRFAGKAHIAVLVIHGSIARDEEFDVANAEGLQAVAPIDGPPLGGKRADERMTWRHHWKGLFFHVWPAGTKIPKGTELRVRSGGPREAAVKGLSDAERARAAQMLAWCRQQGYYPLPKGFQLPKVMRMQVRPGLTPDGAALEAFDAWAGRTVPSPPYSEETIPTLNQARDDLWWLAYGFHALGMTDEADRYHLRALEIQEVTPMSQTDKAAAGFVMLAAGAAGGGAAGAVPVSIEAAGAGKGRGVDAAGVRYDAIRAAWAERAGLVAAGRAYGYGFCRTCGTVV